MGGKIKIIPENAGDRLDRFLVSLELGLSRSRARKLIDGGFVLVNGGACKASTILKSGEEVTVEIPELKPLDLEPENIPLDVVYEDGDIMVVNKPPGMVTHPSAGHSSGTLVNAVLHHSKGLSGIGGVTRPGIVHRLDKDTSGLIVVAKNDGAHLSISGQLMDRSLSRRYIAIVKGVPTEREGEIRVNIGRHPYKRKKMAPLDKGGKEAVSIYKMLQELHAAAIILVSLKTGRTHQIRVHLASIRHPVIGDKVYSRGVSGYPIRRQALHAWLLTLSRPSDGKLMEFKAPLPSDMAKLITHLGGDPAPYQ